MPASTPRRPALVALAAVTALAALAGTACRAAVDRVFQQPTVAFRGAELRGLGPGGGTVDVRVLVRNPNPYPLRAERATYRLLVGDSLEVGRGEATDSLAVPANDSAEVRLPVLVSLPALAQAGIGALGAGAVAYRIVGEVRASTPVGSFPVPLDARGRAALRLPPGMGGLGGLLGR